VTSSGSADPLDWVTRQAVTFPFAIDVKRYRDDALLVSA
jgi:hypothetical protein